MRHTKAIRRHAGALFVLAAGVPGAADASASGTDGFKMLRQSAGYQQGVLDTAKETNAYKTFVCSAARLTLEGPLYVLNKPVFDQEGKALSGDWAERIVVRGCGPDHALNVLVHVKSPGAIKTEPLLPGTTNASLQLQMDAIGFAFDAARVDRNGCRPIYILDTDFREFFAQPDPSIDREPWTELWTVVQCDKRTVVKMTFVPDKTGTAIGASSDTGTR